MKKNLFSLMAYIAVFNTYAQITLTIQPDAAAGKDATVFFLNNQSGTFGPSNTTNYGNFEAFSAMEWTWLGNPGRRHGLLDFDISVIPPNSVITSASLSLYAFPDSEDGGHNPLSGSNSCYLSKIISPWNENTVTWNTKPSISTANQIVLLQSTSVNDNYLDINVTSFIQDKYSNPAGNHGFALSMITPNYYRSLIFASSDHPDAQKRPKLVVNYLPSTNSLDEVNYAIDLAIYPNPSNGVFAVKIEKDFSYRVITLSGQAIIAGSNKGSADNIIDLTGYAKGIYLVEIDIEGVKTTKRIELY